MKFFSIFFIILGSVLFLLSSLFKITHWPGTDVLIISGILVMTTGIVISLKQKKRNE